MMIKNLRIVLAVLWAAAIVVEATVRCVFLRIVVV
jgi:hypothetical protein